MHGIRSRLRSTKMRTEFLGGTRTDRCISHCFTVGFGRQVISVAGFGTSSRAISVNSGHYGMCDLISISYTTLPSLVQPCAGVRIGGASVPISLLTTVSGVPGTRAIICGRVIFLPGRGERLTLLSGGGGQRTDVPGPDGRVTIRSVGQIRRIVTQRDGRLICARFGLVITMPTSASLRGYAGRLRGTFKHVNVRVSGETCGRLRLFIGSFPNGYCNVGRSCSHFLALNSTTVYLVCGRRVRRDRRAPLGVCCASHRNIPITVSVAKGRKGGGLASGSGFFYLNPSNDNGDFRVGSIIHRLCRRKASIIVISANGDCRKLYRCLNNGCVSCARREPVAVGPFHVGQTRVGIRGANFLGGLILLV